MIIQSVPFLGTDFFWGYNLIVNAESKADLWLAKLLFFVLYFL